MMLETGYYTHNVCHPRTIYIKKPRRFCIITLNHLSLFCIAVNVKLLCFLLLLELVYRAFDLGALHVYTITTQRNKQDHFANSNNISFFIFVLTTSNISVLN